MRLAIYILPTLLFLLRIQSVLQAMRCQTSPLWSQMQYGAPGRQLGTDFAGEGGFMWRLSSALLFWESLETSCTAVNMSPVPGAHRPSGSLALLWPLFLSLAFSQFVETLACALQGRRGGTQEVGMTIFEHSLAFAEAESLVTKPFFFSSTDFTKPKSVFTPEGKTVMIGRSVLSQFANVPPEVLLISLISSFSHLTSNILAILGLRARYRLVTTGVWGIAYMASFGWSFLRFISLSSDTSPQVGILRFPTVCIVGFIPHLLILVGIAACGLIYMLAFFLTVLSPPPGQPHNLSWRERFSVAYANLHANIHLSSITPLTISWQEDFYTAILKVGFTVLTAASEAVYLNEGTKIKVDSMTWLEKKRLQDHLTRRRMYQQSAVPQQLLGDAIAEGTDNIDTVRGDLSGGSSASGYARERKTRQSASYLDSSRAAGDGGVGFQQRRGRFLMTYDFIRGIFRLLFIIQAQMTIAVLQRLRITYMPGWLRRLARQTEKGHNPTSTSGSSRRSRPSEPWLILDEPQTFIRPSSTHSDIEDLARERLLRSGFYEERGLEEAEQHLTDSLYSFWKNGGKFGNVDTSGDYVPPQDDDTTSVMSMSTTNDTDAWSDISDGQRTPTQRHPLSYSRQGTPQPDSGIDLSRLSHLLDPKTQEDREEARLLARHLQSPGVMTRSRFRKEVEREELRLLTSSRLPIRLPTDSHTTPEEEESILENFILDRRSNGAGNAQGAGAAGTWDSGAEGMGSEGPQCVVCQLSPRSILVWPCGCLSLCDECRVGLASKNYTTCVCCRTNVVAYSRLYVP
jgi:hypothetical protein